MSVKLLLFYMNKCRWCDEFKPTWKQLKENNPNYEFYECESNDLNNSKEADEIINKFGDNALNGFPSIFICINKIYHRYNGNRSYDDIINFININGANENENKDDSNKISMYYFYMDGCSWCKKFDPIWNELKEKTDYDLYKYERSDMKKSPAPKIEKALNLNITSFPAIFIKIQDDYYKYEGERTVKDILNFIEHIINKNKYIQNGGKIDYRNKYKKYKKMYCEILEKYNKLLK